MQVAESPGASDIDAAAPNVVAEQIFDAPAEGMVGLAIKAFFFAYEVCAEDELVERCRGDDPAALGRFRPEGNYSIRYDPRTDTSSDVAHLFMMRHALRGL